MVEGGFVVKEQENEVVEAEGGTSVGLKCGGYGSRPKCSATEIGQSGAISEHTMEAKGKPGDCSGHMDSNSEGFLTLEPEVPGHQESFLARNGVETIERRQQHFSIVEAVVIDGEHRLVLESRVGVGEVRDEGV